MTIKSNKNKIKCANCGEYKARHLFYKHKKSKTGYSYKCSECKRLIQNKRNNSKREQFIKVYGKIPTDKELEQFTGIWGVL